MFPNTIIIDAVPAVKTRLYIHCFTIESQKVRVKEDS